MAKKNPLQKMVNRKVGGIKRSSKHKLKKSVGLAGKKGSGCVLTLILMIGVFSLLGLII